MNQSEKNILHNIELAFEVIRSSAHDHSWVSLTNEWIEQNQYIFEKINSEEALYYLPAYMSYSITQNKANPQSMVYMKTLDAINEYSKCKNSELKHLNLKFIMSEQQLIVVGEYLKYLRYNQSANIDVEQLDRMLRNWGKNLTRRYGVD